MKFRTKITAALAVVLGIASISFTASPAMASPADCNYDGTVCLVENADWTGRVWRQFPSQIIDCRNLEPDFNDKATIAVNNTDSSIGLILYEHANCQGEQVFVVSGQYATFYEFNDKASSVRIQYF
jgi:hypothetical protein